MGVSQNISGPGRDSPLLAIATATKVLTRRSLRLRARYRKQRITPPLAENRIPPSHHSPKRNTTIFRSMLTGILATDGVMYR